MTFRALHIVALFAALIIGFAPSAALAGEGEDPLGIGGMIEALVLSEFESVERVEVPGVSRFVPKVEDGNLDDIEIDVSPAGPLRGNRLGIRVAASRAGRILKRGVLTVRVQGVRDVVVAKRNVRARQRIGTNDVEVVPRPLSELQPDALTDADAVIGQRARRSLRKGRSVRSSALESSPDVVRGQRVRLQLRVGGLRIDAVGQAKEDGREGEWIRVLNQSSRREVMGRVLGEGVVHVDL